MPNNLPLNERSYREAAHALGTDIPTVMAVKDVESYGNGFLPSGKPKILFEGHIFSRLTRGKHDHSDPTISYPHWTTAHYLGGESEYKRLNRALEINPQAAMMSTSWGLFQILGSNFRHAGFESVDDFVAAMRNGEEPQLDAFVLYVKSVGLDDELRRKDWEVFARGYNGPAYWKNHYAEKLEAAYRKRAGVKSIPPRTEIIEGAERK